MKENELMIACWDFLKATEDQQKKVLALFNEKEKEAFLRMVSFFRILIDKTYHDKIMAETLGLYLSEIGGEDVRG